MKIFTSAQIHELDKYTIENEPVSSLDLMERASKTLTRAIMERWSATVPVVVFAGPGNNGGDALAVARMLAEENYQVQVYLFNISGHLSPDCMANKKRLQDCKRIKQFVEAMQEFEPPYLNEGMLVVDGLFGSGLNKPLAGGFASLVKYINQSPSEVVSIDVPSGLMTEDNTYNIRANIIRATVTVNCIFPGSSEKPGASAHTIKGIKISNIIVIPNKITISQEKTFLAKLSSFFISVYIGIKIAESAPSPNKSRKRLGNLNAAKKMSDIRPAPKKRAINISRTNPKIRLMPVMAPTPNIFFPNFITKPIFFFYFFICFIILFLFKEFQV